MDTEFFTFKDTTASNATKFSGRFSVYPVPAGRMLHIEGLENLTGSIELYSLTGTLVLKKRFQEQVEIAHLDPGIYYFLARDQKGQILGTRRVIKY